MSSSASSCAPVPTATTSVPAASMARGQTRWWRRYSRDSPSASGGAAGWETGAGMPRSNAWTGPAHAHYVMLLCRRDLRFRLGGGLRSIAVSETSHAVSQRVVRRVDHDLEIARTAVRCAERRFFQGAIERCATDAQQQCGPILIPTALRDRGVRDGARRALAAPHALPQERKIVVAMLKPDYRRGKGLDEEPVNGERQVAHVAGP